MATVTSALHWVASSTGLAGLVRRLNRASVVLAYHNVVERPTSLGDAGLHLELARFSEQIDWLRSVAAIVPLSELASRVRMQKSIAGLACVTFDDAYRGALRHALPMLDRCGIPYTVFVASGPSTAPAPFWWDLPDTRADAGSDAWREQRLIREQGDGARIRAALGDRDEPTLPDDLLPASWQLLRSSVRNREFIGAHSVTHRALTAIDEHSLQQELSDSRAAIEREMGVTPTAFAYPYGIWNPAVRDATRRANYAAAFSLEGYLVRRTSDVHSIPRISVHAALTQSTFESWVSGYLDLRYNRQNRSR